MEDSRSKVFAERFEVIYEEGLEQIDRLKRKGEIVVAVMDAVDKRSKVPQHIKNLVRYEMAVRSDMEIHKACDIIFGKESAILDKRSADGSRVKCRICAGNGRVKCKSCGGTGETERNGKVEMCPVCHGAKTRTCVECHGIGRMLDHEFSLMFKHLYATGNISRTIEAVMGGGQGVMAGMPADVLENLFLQLYSNGVRDDDAKKSLKESLVMIPGFTEADLDEFVKMYGDYCKAKDGADAKEKKDA
jgi:hypothetical protein